MKADFTKRHGVSLCYFFPDFNFTHVSKYRHLTSQSVPQLHLPFFFFFFLGGGGREDTLSKIVMSRKMSFLRHKLPQRVSTDFTFAFNVALVNEKLSKIS